MSSNATLKMTLFMFTLFVSAGCAANRIIYPATPSYAEFFTVKTQDDWLLAVQHYPPQGPAKNKPPVILCHGLNHNYLTWDLAPRWSLALTLAANGYDVWSASLRGSGKSTKAGWVQFLELNQPQIALPNLRRYDYRKFNWNLDDYIHEDVPAILRFVQEKTGKKEVTWIGHSLGGMVLFAYLGVYPDPGIQNAILIGTPGKIHHPPSVLVYLIENQKPVVRMSLLINTTNLSVFSAPFSPRIAVPLQHLWYNRENMTQEMQRRFHTQVIENTSPGVIQQVQLMVRTGDFYSADGKVNYTATLPQLKANLLCLAGKLDNLAPPASVLVIYNAAQSPDKTYRLFGIVNGYSADYGHNDLLLGKNAPQEVYATILSWLDRH